MTINFPDRFNLADYYLYDRLNEGYADKQAILYGQRSWTYSEVAEKSQYLAGYLQQAGLKPEERVYIVLPDSPAFAWSIFGTWTAAGVLAMGNPDAPVEELAYVLDYIKAKVLITTAKVADDLSESLNNHPGLVSVLVVPETRTGEDPESNIDIPASLTDSSFEVTSLSDSINVGKKSPVARPSVHQDDMACWLFTSGSTGRPKAAMHCHRDFAFNTEAYAKGTIGYQADDVTVSVPRLFFGYATGTNLFFPFSVGATTALYSERPTPDSLAEAIKHYQPTIVTNVPTMLGKLLTERPDVDLSCLRLQLSAGEALPPTLLSKFTEQFGTDIYDGIGSAEMFHIYCTNRPGDIKAGSLGTVVDGYELKILPSDAEGPGAKECQPGETGVLWVKGDSVASGYYRNRDKSWATFHGHWCRTGDLFSMDESGYLWFQGRSDDLFKVNGRWIAPQEIEECLLQHPSVAACVVIPFKLDGLTKPKAIVVLKSDYADQELTEELQKHVQENKAMYKWPRQIEFVPDIARNDRGKIDRKHLIKTMS